MVMYYEASEKLDNLIEYMNKNEKDILDKIDEAIKKPSFEEFFLNKKNKRILSKKFLSYYDDIAAEKGQEFLEDERFYSEEELEEIEVSPEEAYDNFAHTDGYSAYYEAAAYTIEDFKKKYDYKRNDESDEDKQYALANFLGFKPSW